MKEKILLSWSGGKDSAMALRALASSPEYQVAALLTTVTQAYDRISMHGVRRVLLERQADSLGLPLDIIGIPPACINAEYETKMRTALMRHLQCGIQRVAFGDIFLEDLRAYRESRLAQIGMQALFPIWKQPTDELLRSFLGLGFQAIVVCVDPKKLSPSFAGRLLEEQFLRDLPAGVDPCGENGEFHTFVFNGPIFRQPIRFTRGDVVERDGFWFCDLMPANGV